MTAPYRGVDFFELDRLLTPEERAARDRVRAWVDAEVLPHVEELYLRGEFRREWVPQMAALGLLGPTVPAEYGGAGLNGVSYGLMMQEVERGDSGLRSFASVQSSLVMYPILAFGSEAQRRHWLPRLARGEEIGCFGLTEPAAGSNPAAMTTRATRTADGWLLHGTKRWLSNGPSATVAVVWAKTGDDAKSIRGFLVPTASVGVRVHAIHNKHSLRVSESSWMEFDQVALPADALLPESGGLKSPLLCLSQARYGIAWGAIGAAMACYDEAVRYATSREMFGRPIGQTQLQQSRLAEMLTGITSGQLLAYHLGRLKDEGRVTPAQVSLAKRQNVHVACEVAREARRLLGGNGILTDFQSMRHMANLEAVYTYEGTHDIHSLIVGQAITGLAAY